MKDIFIEGAIAPSFIANAIDKHQSKHNIGAHQIFLGQVRADQLQESVVKSINYSSYKEMANERMAEIREEIFNEYPITCMHVYHSLGKVAVGEICLFVFVSSPHRADSFRACEVLVERIKNELPIWGVEFLENGSSIQKVNS
ncbi:MAG TPA: molybdenum cofactor biosynthesis protein MoaE [Bacteroidia bacterium]|nr:molybdenum cofactor biosynthesis protein MoaE [Bacteroidia bacterium]HNT79932.1 molybdenum cofactor biosynthesis protein MoaE [Bacteroidia bacterium]